MGGTWHMFSQREWRSRILPRDITLSLHKVYQRILDTYSPAAGLASISIHLRP